MDQKIIDLYDHYTHGGMNRRQFLDRLTQLVGGTAAATTALSLIESNYALAQTIPETDPRIAAETLVFSVGDTKVSGYLVKPTAAGKHPAVIVIHENRGLNPYIEDVARRLALDGFLALAPDGLFPVGGYPGNDDDGRVLQAKLDQAKLRTDMLNGARYLRSHKLSNGKLGATGFCSGGGTVNWLATQLGADMQAGAPYYGPAAATAEVPKINSALLLHFAANDPNINKLWPGYEAALKSAGVEHQAHTYEKTLHGFHNNSTPRYNETAAKLSWERTVAFFRKHLA